MYVHAALHSPIRIHCPRLHFGSREYRERAPIYGQLAEEWRYCEKLVY